MKRLLVVGVVVLAVAMVVLVAAALQAPRFLEARLERALGRPVALEGARWVWPAGLDVRRIAIADAGEFAGTDALIADSVTMRLRPLALVGRTLDFTSVVVGRLDVTVRKHQGAITHPLSAADGARPASRWAIRVADLRVEDGTVRFIDHDLAPDRFEAGVGALSAAVRTDERGEVQYRVNGQLDQGDRHPAGRVAFTATTDADTRETASELQVEGAAVAFFGAYLRSLTSTRVDRGVVALRSRTETANRVWRTNARIDVSDLAIAGVGQGRGPVFGLEPSNVIGLFSDPSGTVSLDVAFTWDRSNPAVTFQQALGNGVRDAVQARVASSLPTILGGLLGALQSGEGGAAGLFSPGGLGSLFGGARSAGGTAGGEGARGQGPP